MPDLVELYVNELELRGSRPSSIRVVTSNLHTVEEDCGPLDKISADDITHWLDTRRTSDGSSISAATRWNYISGLNRFYSWAIESGHLSSNPVSGMTKPPVESNSERRSISGAELERAINGSAGELRSWIVLAAYEGLRPQEVAQIDWADVDLEADPPVLLVKRDGQTDRIVELNPRALDALDDLPEPHSGRMFPSANAGMLSTRINRHLSGLGIAARADNLRTWFKSDEYWKQELSTNQAQATRPAFCEVIKRAVADYDPEAQEAGVLAAEEQRREFVAKFPPDGWDRLTLDDYALGQPDHLDNVCRWMEFVTTDLGSMKGGNARKHLIYRQSTGDWWYDHNKYDSLDEAWLAVRKGFIEAIDASRSGDWDRIGQIDALSSGPALVNKLLATYFEDELLPINSQNHLRHFLKALGAAEADDPALGTTLLNRALLACLRSCPELSGWSTKEMERLLYSTFLSPIPSAVPGSPIADVPGFVARILEDVSERLEFRRSSEDQARKLLDEHAGAMTEEQSRDLFRLFNADWYRGKQVQTRFSPAFVGQTANGLVSNLESFNTWSARLWKGSDQDSRSALGELLSDRKLLHSAGTSYPTVLRYLRQPDSAAVWLGITDRGLQRLTDYRPIRGPGNGTLEDYERFNIAAVELMAEYEIPPELLDCLLAEAGRVVEEPPEEKPPGEAAVWLFQANPSIYDIDHALSEQPELTWVVRQYKSEVKAGDRVYLWRSGPDAGIVATARVISDPAVLPGDPKDPYVIKPEALSKPELRVRLEVETVLPSAIKRTDLQDHAVLKDLVIIRFANATNYRITPEEDQALQTLLTGLRIPPVQPELEERVFLPVNWLQKLVDALSDKGQVILYGPPGTGKTYVAIALAEDMTRDGGEVRIVQFHPTYSYEDFVGGFRPVEDDGAYGVRYKRIDGPLRDMARRAAADSSHPYVLIVDEINRGNIPKIFGELLFLLEYRKKAVRLQYWPDEDFSLPRNLYLIGTMNTADRSIALVDTALRRRFYFFEFSPIEEPVSKVLELWLDKHGHSRLAADLLKELNKELEVDEVAIGPSYFMVDPETGPPLERIWDREILPLLEEYKYGTIWDPKRFQLDAMIRRVAGPASDEEPAADGVIDD